MADELATTTEQTIRIMQLGTSIEPQIHVVLISRNVTVSVLQLNRERVCTGNRVKEPLINYETTLRESVGHCC